MRRAAGELVVDTVRLVGECTNICVLYTAADARNVGYAVEVGRDLEKTPGATIL